MSLRTSAVLAALLAVVGVGENTLFGSDTAETARHGLSVAFFLLAVVGFVALVAIGVAALVRRARRTA